MTGLPHASRRGAYSIGLRYSRRRHAAFLPLLESALAVHRRECRGSSSSVAAVYAALAAQPAESPNVEAERLASCCAAECSGAAPGAMVSYSDDLPCAGTVDIARLVRDARANGAAAAPVLLSLAVKPPPGCPPSTAAAAAENSPLVGVVHRNHGPYPAVARVLGATFHVPPRCAFAVSDASHLPRLVGCLGEGAFELIVIDPPWCDHSSRPEQWR